MNKFTKIIEAICLPTGTVLTMTQTNELFQLISLIITCIAGALTIVTIIVTSYIKLRAWYVKAKADGKITSEELQAGIDIIQDTVTDVTEKVDTIKTDIAKED